MKAESEKRGLGSIEIKLCQLEKSAEGDKADEIRNDENEDEMTFLRAVTRSGTTVKVNFKTRESQMTFLLSAIISQH